VTLLVVGLVAAVLVGKDPLNMWPSHSPATATVTSPAPVTSPMPGEPTSEGSDPFAGSPAKSYADGASGITLPAARATAGLPVKDVELLLRKTRALLTASDLDPGTLFDGDTGSFARQLDPEQRRYFTSSLRSKDQKKNLRSWLVNFAPKTAELTGSVIKVHGESTLSAATRQGHRGALVQVNYLFVYPVHQPLQPETTIRVIAHMRGEAFRFRDASGERTWIYRWDTTSLANTRCDIHDGYVHPAYPGARLDMVEASGVPVDPYDLKDDLKDDPGNDEGCRTATRT
jgi:hypothetical protein